MIIAISASENNIEGSVDPRFGRCNYFYIYDSDSKKGKFIPNEGQASAHGAGTAAAQMIINENVSAVVTGRVGPNAFRVLQSAGIDIRTTQSGSIKTAIDDMINGKLQRIETSGPAHMGMGGGFKGGR